MLKKEEYFKAVRRLYTPLQGSIIWSGYRETKNFSPFLLVDDFAAKGSLVIDYIWYYLKKELEESAKLTCDAWEDPIFFKKAVSLFDSKEKDLLHVVNKDFKTFSLAFEAYMPALLLVWIIERPIELKLEDLLSKELSEKEVNELMSVIKMPLKDNFYKEEEYNLVKAVDLESHVKKYEWIYSRYGEEILYTKKDAEERLKEIDKNKYLKTYKEEKDKIKKAILKTKSILKSNAHFVDILQFIIYYRTQRTDIMNRSFYEYIPKLKYLAKEKGLTYEQLLFCTKEEVLGKIPSLDLIKERQKGFVMVMIEGEIKCYVKKKADEIRKIFKEDIEDIKEIKGAPACEGVVKGVVKLIFSREDFSKVKDGDILVTSMTTPNMIPIMKKVSAFVTDEGGITCHAAIISREMNKPCIIGTKNATSILKDNDIIEVDANKGIIKIIS